MAIVGRELSPLAFLEIYQVLELERKQESNYKKMQQHLRFFFIFSETGVTKNVVVREMLRTTDLNSSKLWDVGTGLIEKATNIYKDNMRKYGLENPWVSENNSRAFMDEELPAWLHVETEEDCLN